VIRLLSISFVLLALSHNVRAENGKGNTDYIDFTKYKPVGVNLTEKYLDLFEKNGDIATPLKGVQVLFIEGILANYVHIVGDLIMKKFGTYTYFDTHEAFMKSIGVGVTRVKLETENSSYKNAIEIAKAIRAENKKVVLFTHSKGGMDALMALVNYPELIEKTVGIVAVQSPFLGTPVADFIADTQPWSTIADMVLKVMGGSGESLADLSTRRRVPWYKGNQTAIMKIQSKIPILSFASYKLPVEGKEDSVFKFSRDLMYNRMGVESDGLVPWKSAILPGGAYIVVEGIDHATSVSNTKFTVFDQVKFTRALFSLFFTMKN
jgi:hypothetical protein